MMVVEPERSLEYYVQACADHILFQAEPGSTVRLHRVLSRFRSLGARPDVIASGTAICGSRDYAAAISGLRAAAEI